MTRATSEGDLKEPTTLPMVLVADDDPDVRETLMAILELSGFAVCGAADGTEALAVARSQPLDLLLLDYTMPGLSGPEVCRAVKQEPATRHLPVILLTGRTEAQDRANGLSAGADEFLIKPFAPDALMAKMRTLLRRAAGG